MDRKKGQRYSKEFRHQAVERMNACDNISRLSGELGVARHLLYNWRDRSRPASPGTPQRILTLCKVLTGLFVGLHALYDLRGIRSRRSVIFGHQRFDLNDIRMQIMAVPIANFEPIPYRIRIGVTGHRKLDDPAAMRQASRSHRQGLTNRPRHGR